MKQVWLFLTLAVLGGGQLQAQSADSRSPEAVAFGEGARPEPMASDEDSVKAAVNSLFEGMKNADAEMIRAAFADSAILQTITRNKEGNTIIRNEAVSNFATIISKLEKGAADERITFATVNIDGPLAIAWTPYKFYFNGKFSHCGVNSFQLVRFDGVWKIQYLIDTRRKTGCD